MSNIGIPNITTTWNGSAFDHTESITVAVGTTHLVVRMRGSTEEPDTVEYDGTTVPKLFYTSDTSAAGIGGYALLNPDSGTLDLIINTGGSARTYQLTIDEFSGTVGIGDADYPVGGYIGDRSVTLTTVSGDTVLDVLTSPTTMAVAVARTTQLLNTNFAGASSLVATGVSTTMGWTHTADFSAIAAFVLTAGSPAASVNPPDPVTDGATAQTYSPLNFDSGNITAITLDGVNVPAFTQTTFDNFDVAGVTVDGTAGPKFGSVVFEATNGTETANDTIINQPAADHAYVIMAVIDTVTPDALYQLMLTQLSKTLAPNDQFYWNDADGSIINDDSTFAIVVPKTFWWYEVSSGEWWTLTLSAGGLSPVIRTKYRRFPWQTHNKL